MDFDSAFALITFTVIINGSKYASSVLQTLAFTCTGIIGFIDFWITFDSGCINQIAVLTGLRHKGVGFALLSDAERRLNASGVQNLTLEVRTHNKHAIALYEKSGFTGKFIKKAYYDNGDDALYMEKRLGL